MPLKIYDRDGRGVFWVSGTIKGKAIRESLGTRDKHEAEELRAALEARAFKRGVYGEDAVRTFDEAVTSYIEAGGEKRFLEPLLHHFAGRLLTSIKAGEISTFAKKLLRGCRPATLNRSVLVPARAVINHGASLGWCHPIRVPRFKEEKPLRRSVDRAWVEAFMAQADADGMPELSALVLFMFQTGARLSEAHRVRAEHVDVHRLTVLLERTKTDRNDVRHINRELMLRLANLPPRAADRPLLSDTVWGRTTRYRMRAVCKRAGIDYVPPHQAGRHSFATRANALGANLKEIMDAGGWKSPRVVLDYIHAKDAGPKIAALFAEEALHENPHVQSRDSASGGSGQVVDMTGTFRR